MTEDELRDFMASMASEMPVDGGIPRQIVELARRRLVASLAVAVAMAAGVVAGGVVAAQALIRTGQSRQPIAPAPTEQHSPVAPEIRFVRLYRDRSTGAAVDDGYTDGDDSNVKWSIFSMDPETGVATYLGAPVPSGSGRSLEWSADGSRIALVRASGQGLSHGGEIWRVNVDGSDPVQLTNNDNGDYGPAWSPDGNRIAFVSDRADPNANQVGHAPISDLYVMDADGNGVTRLTESSGCGGNGVESPSWSPDGARIAFSMPHLEGTECWFDLFTMAADGTDITQLTESPGREGTSDWSPDGTRIAFDRYGDGSTDVFVVNADGTGEVRLTEDTAHDYLPAWSPDGTEIVFSSQRDFDGTNFLGKGDPGDAELYVMNADGSGQTRLTHDPAWDGAATWVGG